MVGFVLGMKHAVEPDHFIAVSTIASRSKKLWRSSLAGVFWGIGHSATLLVTGIVLILLKAEIPEKWALTLEFAVGIMLVYLGIMAMRSLQGEHLQADSGNEQRSYLKCAGIGLVHGLAGSGALVLLTMSSLSGVGAAFMYIVLFGAGTVLGMLIVTTIIGIPFAASASKLRLHAGLGRLAGAVSLVFGLYYMYNLGFTEGLFQLWLQ